MKKTIEPVETFKKSNTINVIVDTPKGSMVKYAYSSKSDEFHLERLLPEGMSFPFNYGFIPSTIGKDGDPIDVIVLNEQSIVMGCSVKVRLLGVLEAEQTENDKFGRNDKVIGMATDEETPLKFLFSRLDEGRINQIGYFFAAYNKISGKKFKILKMKGTGHAEKLIQEGIKKFKKKQKNAKK